MGLSDELYIKMNSRGKPLTEFEHFKAEFEGMIKESDEEMSKEFNRKFDLDWTDMLFPYRGENKIIDDKFMRYFFFVSDILCYQQSIPLEKDAFKLAKQIYGKDNTVAKENLDFLKSSFDCWCNLDIDDFFKKIFSNNTYESGKVKIYQSNLNIFKQCCDDYGEYEGRNRKFPLNLTLLLYAVVVYLQNKNDVSECNLQRRIRIVRNLIWNSRDEIRDDNMAKLLAETKEIILNGIIPTSTGYNKSQKDEEQAKIDWLLTNADKQYALFHLEDHSLLYGCVAVIGLENYANFDKFRELFNNINWDLISKALLAKGDYSQVVGWHWQLGTKNDSTWKDLFHPSNQRKGFDKTKIVLNDLLASLTAIEAIVLQNVIDTYLNNPNTLKDWRFYIVRYWQYLRPQRQGYYHTDENDYITYRMNAKQLNGYHWNIFIETLYYELDKNYPIDYDGYKGCRLKIADVISVQSTADKFIIYKLDNNNWKFDSEIAIPQDGNGFDTQDRVEWMKNELVNLGY